MVHKVILIVFSVASVAFAAGTLGSFLHPFHWSDVWDDGAQWIDCRPGQIYWLYETDRSKWASVGPWGEKQLALPHIAGISSSNDGCCSGWIHGLSMQWCRQPTHYRQYRIFASFLDLALICLIYPVISFVLIAARRAVRRRRGQCLNCAYDLTGNVSDSCPECGREFVR